MEVSVEYREVVATTWKRGAEPTPGEASTLEPWLAARATPTIAATEIAHGPDY
jgi:hypothetical protein